MVAASDHKCIPYVGYVIGQHSSFGIVETKLMNMITKVYMELQITKDSFFSVSMYSTVEEEHD